MPGLGKRRAPNYNAPATPVQPLPPAASVAAHDAFAARVGAAEPRIVAVDGDALDALQAGILFDFDDLVAARLQRRDHVRRYAARFQFGRSVAAADVGQADGLLHIEVPVQRPDQHLGDVVDDGRAARRTGRYRGAEGARPRGH